MTSKSPKVAPGFVGRNFIASLSNGLRVLEAAADANGDISLGALARRVGLQKTSVWRLAHTLVRLGYLHQDPETRNFRPAPRVLALGYAYFDGLDLKQLSIPFLRELSARLNETVSMAVLDGDELIYVERIKSSQIVAINLHVGSHLPLYRTCLGRALICEMPAEWLQAYIERISDDPQARPYIEDGARAMYKALEETRERGYALNDEESTKGLRVIGCPIRDRSAEIVAAVCISVPSSRWTVSDLRKRVAPDLLAAAGKISLALGYRGKPLDQEAAGHSGRKPDLLRPVEPPLPGVRAARANP